MGAAGIAFGGLQVLGAANSAFAADREGRANEAYYNALARQAFSQANLVEVAAGEQAHAVQDAAAGQFGQHVRDVKRLEGSQAAAAAAAGISGSVTQEDIERDTARSAALDEAVIRYNADSQADAILRQAKAQAIGLREEGNSYYDAGHEARSEGKRKAWSSIIGGATSVANTAFQWSASNPVAADPTRATGFVSASRAKAAQAVGPLQRKTDLFLRPSAGTKRYF